MSDRRKWFCVIVTVALAAVLAATAQCEPVLNPANGHYYECVYEPLFWAQADQAAKARSYQGVSGYLATITSASESEFVTGVCCATGYYPYAWLGGSQPPGSPEPDGNWQWVTGEEWTYSNWLPNEPNNSGNLEHCLTICCGEMGGRWNDIGNDSPDVHWYIVEYEPAPDVPKLELAKTVDKATAKPGEQLAYSITCANAGNAPATSVVITDSIPVNTKYVKGTTKAPVGWKVEYYTDKWVPSEPGAGAVKAIRWTCTATVSAGSSQTLGFRVRITPADYVEPPFDVANEASATCAELPTAVTSNLTETDVTTGQTTPGTVSAIALGKVFTPDHSAWNIHVLAKGVGSPIVKGTVDVLGSATEFSLPPKALYTDRWVRLGSVPVGPCSGEWVAKLQMTSPAQAVIGTVEAAMSGFEPDVHGFHFTNYGAVGDFLGMCTGMSATAVVYRRAGKPIPPDREPPPVGSPLYMEILWNHGTWNAGILPKFPRALAYGSDSLAWRAETDFVAHEITAGRECVVSFVGLPGHTLVAAGVLRVSRFVDQAVDAVTTLESIWLYDPEYPDDRSRFAQALVRDGSWVVDLYYDQYKRFVCVEYP